MIAFTLVIRTVLGDLGHWTAKTGVSLLAGLTVTLGLKWLSWGSLYSLARVIPLCKTLETKELQILATDILSLS